MATEYHPPALDHGGGDWWGLYGHSRRRDQARVLPRSVIDIIFRVSWPAVLELGQAGMGVIRFYADFNLWTAQLYLQVNYDRKDSPLVMTQLGQRREERRHRSPPYTRPDADSKTDDSEAQWQVAPHHKL